MSEYRFAEFQHYDGLSNLSFEENEWLNENLKNAKPLRGNNIKEFDNVLVIGRSG